MANRYAATCISGLQELIEQALRRQLPQMRAVCRLDGLIIFETDTDLEALPDLRYINNLFSVIQTFDGPRESAMRRMLEAVARSGRIGGPRRSPARTFRVIASDEGRTVAVDDGLLRGVESVISKSRRLKVSRARPDLEFWLLRRREGLGLFLERLTRHKTFDKSLEKGELRPDLANALCLMSDPGPDDVFLDPFCGHGAIPLERARAAPFKLMFATDADADAVKKLRRKVKATGRKRLIRSIIAKRTDALELTGFDDGFITKIVTDPPWGAYADVAMGLGPFYARMLRTFHRVLAPRGIAVVLTAAREQFDAEISGLADRFERRKVYNLLVSGKKAGAYVLRKRA